MLDINLTQSEADALIAMEKHCVDEQEYPYPALGGNVRIPLQSIDGREEFHLDITRGRIDISKGTYQNRARHTVILIRLDISGPTHQNPDGNEIQCPHIHLYREGYADKWAFPIPTGVFTDFTNLRCILDDFMRYCNITRPPIIERGLFQ